VTEAEGEVHEVALDGQVLRFLVKDRRDVVQRHHLEGRIYEPEELAIIAGFFPAGGVFADIGANVGNHCVHVGRFLRPARIIVFEPTPEAIAILRRNIALNGLEALVDASHLGLGLSDQAGGAVIRTQRHNLGNSRLVKVAGEGEVRLVTGDAALAGQRVDFIKMDVEGMEIRALAGLKDTIARWRPRLFVEVNDGNDRAFRDWVAAQGYRIARSFRRYPTNENHMAVPAES
jgi:FkbM family methyltransferase